VRRDKWRPAAPTLSNWAHILPALCYPSLMKHARVLAQLETTFPFVVQRRSALVCASIVFLHLKYIIVQDDNLSRGTCILKGFWNFAACLSLSFIIMINGRAGVNCEMGGTCGTYGETSARDR
jgi:hypothetical protein